MSNSKSALFGTKQEAVLTPKEGYEVVSVEVVNRTNNTVVSSTLTKTCENPQQWTCSFVQPAGVVAVCPKVVPIAYSVVIEDCENCNIVLLEHDDAISITLGTPATGSEPAEGSANFNKPQHSTENSSTGTDSLNVGGNISDNSDGADEAAFGPACDSEAEDSPKDGHDGPADDESTDIVEEGHDVSGADGQGEPSADCTDNAGGSADEDHKSTGEADSEGNSASDDEIGADESSDLDNGTAVDGFDEAAASDDKQEDALDVEDSDVGRFDDKARLTELMDDCIYAAGQFQSVLEDVEPRYISEAERKKKDAAYWNHRRAADAGQITKEQFMAVHKAHMQFLDEIKNGIIIVRE